MLAHKTPFDWLKPNLEIKKRRIRLSSGELESAKKNSDTYSNAIRKEKALAKITNGIGHAGVISMVAGRVVATRRRPLTPLELLYCFPQSVLSLTQPSLRLHAVRQQAC